MIDNPSSLCACMGPMYGEPLCYCEMKRQGLPLNNEARTRSIDRANDALAKLFKWSKPSTQPTEG